MKRTWIAAAGVCLALAGCGGGGEPAADPQLPPQADECSVSEQRSALRTFMQEQYFWNDRMGAADEAARDMDGYFTSLLNRPTDRYSSTQPSAVFNGVFLEGYRTGYGYALAWANADQSLVRVRSVEPLSPVGKAGLRRGDWIISIDGLPPEAVGQGQLPVVTTEGVPREFVVIGNDGQERRFTAISAEYPLTPLSDTRVIETQGADGQALKVGYLAYGQFVGYSQAALNEAIRQFADAGVSEVVLDLRYNGGGSVATSQRLASLLGGTRLVNKTFADMRNNPQRSVYNWTYRFMGSRAQLQGGQPLENLQRLVVITSGATASASELLINGLRPFMPVVLVGATTYGKPYGSTPRDSCGTVYNAIQYNFLNASGDANYASGFAADCEVPDDLGHALGDPREARLAAALTYIREGRCTSAPQTQALRRAPGAGPQPTDLTLPGEALPPLMFAD